MLKAYMKLFSRSLDNKTKDAKKVKPVDVTSTISSKENLYFLVLYLLTINNTMLNTFNNLLNWSVSKKYHSQVVKTDDTYSSEYSGHALATSLIIAIQFLIL